MKTLEYRFADKSDWGVGPWQDEPDKVQWQDEATGLPCLIVRHPSHGFLCGYAGVSEGHPYFAKDWKHTHIDVDVHAEINFSNFCDPADTEHGICHVVEPGENDRVWWLGFDCGHAFDYAPGMESRMRALERRIPGFPKLEYPRFEKYRDIGYVRQQVTELAAQLHEKQLHPAFPAVHNREHSS